jgi:hypothetical protein
LWGGNSRKIKPPSRGKSKPPPLVVDNLFTFCIDIKTRYNSVSLSISINNGCLRENGAEIMSEKDNNLITTQKCSVDEGSIKSSNWQDQWWEDREEVETERVKQYREKWAKERALLKYDQTQNEEKNKVQLNYRKIEESQSTIEDNALLMQSTMCAAFGSASDDYNALLLSQTVNAQFFGQDKDAAHIANATIDALVSMNPKDVIEGQLCSRLIILNNQYMEFMRRTVNPCAGTTEIDMNINRSTKLMRLYNETLDALNKHRRKGEQKVIVQHVNVNNGGQAIVGNIQTGGGGNEKK